VGENTGKREEEIKEIKRGVKWKSSADDSMGVASGVAGEQLPPVPLPLPPQLPPYEI